MYSLLLAAAFAVVPATGASDGASEPPPLARQLSGIVTDTAGTPLVEARVKVLEIGRVTLTNAEGRYTLPNVPTGTYGVSIVRVGYAPEVRRVTIANVDVTLDVSLRPSAVELPELQVTATPLATTALTSPQPTSVLSGDELRTAQSASLGQTLDGIAGVHSIDQGPAIGKPVIRGLSSNRVLILDNGQRIETQQWGDEHSPNIETADAERIEVIRGPASVLYGSDAIGGVINVVKRDLPDALGRPSYLGGGVAAAYSTNNRQPDGMLSLEGASGALGFRGSLTGRTSDDFRTPAGPTFNTGNRAVGGAGSLGLRGSWGSLRGDFSYRDEKPELHDDDIATPFQRLGDTRGTLAATLPMGGSRLEIVTGLERNRRREFEEAGATDVASGLLSTSYKLDARLHHAPIGKLYGIVGVQGFANDFTVSGEEQHLIPSNAVKSVGAYVFEQMDLNRWSLSFGGRYDYRHLDVTADPAPPVGTGTPAQTRTYNSVTGNVGVLYHVTQPVALVLNVGRGFRAPQAVELFANGVHEGTTEYDVGNPELKNETSLNTDLALRVQTERLSFELGAFANYIDNYIYFRPTGLWDTPDQAPLADGDPCPDDFSCFQRFQSVQGNARLIGVEFATDVHPTRELHLSVTADYTRGQNTTTDAPLPLVPPFRAVYSARYEWAGSQWFQKPYLMVGGESNAKQTKLDPNDVAPDGYTLANVGAGFALATGPHAINIDLTLRNAFDTRYQNFLNRYKFAADPVVYDPGRNLTLRLSTQL